MSHLETCGLALVLSVCALLPALGQQCPQPSQTGPSTPSQARMLEGKLIYHDGIRQWFELKLNKPQCGQASIQLIKGAGPYAPSPWASLEILRGCQVQSKGPIDFSPTGYYSLDTYQDVQEIQPARSCAQQPPFPDYSKATPDKTIREYRVDMHVQYEPGDHPITFRVSSAGKELHPWQAYASYLLTGGFVLYGRCGEGFAIDKVFGTPEATPSHFTSRGDPSDMAMFEPESAADSGKKDLHLGYTCIRQQ
jgi:hypothetical protein